MPGEKYVVAAADNPSQIAVRNILNPYGYMFLANCADAISLIRLVRSRQPDFAVIDSGVRLETMRRCIEAIDEEMLCPCIILGGQNDAEAAGIMENFRIVSLCPKPSARELLAYTVGMALVNFRRISGLDRKLKEMAESLETRETVEKAKRILMKRDGISEEEAYIKMRKRSMDTRSSIKAVAEAVIIAFEARDEKATPG